MSRIFLCAALLLSGIGAAVCSGEGAGMKKAVLVIARQDFRDEELFKTKEALESGGIKVSVASLTLGTCSGMLGGKAQPDILLQEIRPPEWDALVFIGGGGAQEYWDDPLAHKLAQEAYASGKIVAAICIAPVTLARAGLLKGKRATVWPPEEGILKKEGALYTGRPVESDGRIITGSGPEAAEEFGREIARALK